MKALPGFFLLLIVKCEKKEKLKEELLSKEEPGLGDLENPQLITKDVKPSLSR